MDNRPNPGLDAQIAAAFDWWREAGVDCDFADTPRDWLAKPEETALAPAFAEMAGVPAHSQAPIPAAPVMAIDRSDLPDDLDAFNQWWLEEPKLDDGRTSGRIPPRGTLQPETMVIVPEPEADDEDRLLSGPQGRLLDAILDALNLDPAHTYIASALPRHTPMADWEKVASRGLGIALVQHVTLVRPRRLLVFGMNIPPLLQNDPAHNRASSRLFNHEDLSIPLFVARGLPALLERPRWKAKLWQELLDWTGTDQST